MVSGTDGCFWQRQSAFGADELSESDGDSSAGSDSDTDPSNSKSSASSSKEASKARLAAKAAGASPVAVPLGDEETKSLIARIKELKNKVLTEEKAATALEVQVASKATALKGVITTAKDDRESGNSMEDQAKKVSRRDSLQYPVSSAVLSSTNFDHLI